MIEIFTALVPVFLIIAFGKLLEARQVLDASTWENLEQLVFYILFPALLVVKIGGAEVPGAELMPLFATLLTTSLVIWLVVSVARPGLKWDSRTFIAVVHGALRPNSYIGLAAAFALYGEAGLTLAAVCILAVIPLVNVLTVYSHHRWTEDDTRPTEGPAKRAFKESSRNPIILACGVGAVLNLTGIGLPPLIGEALDILGRAALALGLLAVGAGLNLRSLRIASRPAAVAVAVKLAVTPVLAVIACGLFGVSGLAVSVAVLFAALPVSASGYVIVKHMGGDGELMAAVVALSTISAMATLPLVVWALGPVST